MNRPLLDTCREICHARIAPVLAIVADLAYAQATLEDGVDDFLVVPVDPMEAILRASKLARASSLVRVGHFEIDLSAWRATTSGITFSCRRSSFACWPAWRNALGRWSVMRRFWRMSN